MPRSFWTQIAASLVAAVAAAVAYWADIRYLPSILILVSALMVTGVFADIEKRVLKVADNPKSAAKGHQILAIVRATRASLLLFMGVLAVALILLQVAYD